MTNPSSNHRWVCVSTDGNPTDDDCGFLEVYVPGGLQTHFIAWWNPDLTYNGAETDWENFPRWRSITHWRRLSDPDSLLEAPPEPPPGLLMSMAIRMDHGLGCPGYYDQISLGKDAPTHKQRLDGAIRLAAQMWEEVVGHGFYRPEKEADYAALAQSTGALTVAPTPEHARTGTYVTIVCGGCRARVDVPLVGREGEYLSLESAKGWLLHPKQLCPKCSAVNVGAEL